MSSQQTSDEVNERGNAIYTAQLQAELEPLHNKQFVAIHIDTGDYAAAKTTAAAIRTLLQRHPADGRIFLRKIGEEPEYGLAARLLSGETLAVPSK